MKSESKKHSQENMVKHFKVVVCGNQSSGKSLFITRLGRFIDFSDIRENQYAKILEGNGLLENSFFFLTILELNSAKDLLENFNSFEFSDLDAVILFSSPEKLENLNFISLFDSQLNETISLNKSRAKIFRVLNKLDLMKDTRVPNIKIQRGDTKISSENFFPLSAQNNTNTKSFFSYMLNNLINGK